MGVTKETIKSGNGVKPLPMQRVSVHYTGTFKDGKVFDSSYKRNRPFQFTVGAGQVIRGWDEGFLMMEVGEKAILHITYDYAYGKSGYAGVIPGEADLDFEVELLEIL